MRRQHCPERTFLLPDFLGYTRKLYFFGSSIISLFSGTNSSSSSGFSGILNVTPSILVVLSLFFFRVLLIGEGFCCPTETTTMSALLDFIHLYGFDLPNALRAGLWLAATSVAKVSWMMLCCWNAYPPLFFEDGPMVTN